MVSIVDTGITADDILASIFKFRFAPLTIGLS